MKFNYIANQLFEGKEETVSISVQREKVHDATLNIDGYKHSMVQVIALTVALKTITVIKNPPLVSDTYVFIGIINELGGKAKLNENHLYVDARNICNHSIPCFLGKAIHGSMYLCPALLMSLGQFEFFGSGGCKIGDDEDLNKRPVDHVVSVISNLGAKVSTEKDIIKGTFELYNKSCEIDIMNYSTNIKYLSGPLVGGATKTAIIMSIYKEKFIIKNAYMKTDVLDMIRFLRLIGKKIKIDNGNIYIEGCISTNEINPVVFSLTQCISEIITYSTLAIASGVGIRFCNLNKEIVCESLRQELLILSEMGIEVKWRLNDLLIDSNGMIKSKDINVLPTTIQSDHHPFFAFLLLYANKGSVLTENVWKDRFHYVDNLTKFGAKITVENNRIFIQPSKLIEHESDLLALDVRSGAVTLLAIILSNSNITLKNAEHILRGYSRLDEQMHLMGINIQYSDGRKE